MSDADRELEDVSEKKSKSVEIPLWLLSLAVPVLAAAYPGLYTLGRDVGNRNLEAYKDVEELALPDLVASLQMASKEIKAASREFGTMLENNASYDELKSNYDLALAELEQGKTYRAEIEERLERVSQSLTESNERLAVLTNPETLYELTRGKGDTFFGGDLFVAVLDVASNNTASIKVDGKEYSVTAGDKVVGGIDQSCTVLIRSASFVGSSVTFNVECEAK